jgi:hypothetical protein
MVSKACPLIVETSPRITASLRSGPEDNYAIPDFLLKLVALANFMRLSSRKGAHAALSSAAKQEIRVSRHTTHRGISA